MNKIFTKCESSNNIIEANFTPRWNYTPKINHDDPVLRKLYIRPRIRPYQPENPAPVCGELALQLEKSGKNFHFKTRDKENQYSPVENFPQGETSSAEDKMPTPVALLNHGSDNQKSTMVETNASVASGKNFHLKTVSSETKESVKPINTRHVIDFQANTITEQMKRAHCAIMVDMLERLAECWYPKRNYVTQDMIYAMYELHDWTCPITGHRHSTHKPLTIEFIHQPLRGGRIEIANIRPRYRNGWMPGYYNFTGNKAWFETDSEMIA